MKRGLFISALSATLIFFGAVMLGACKASPTAMPPTTTPSRAPSPSPTSTLAPTATPLPSPFPTPTLAAGTYLSPTTASALERIEREMDDLAGLTHTLPLTIARLPKGEMSARGKRLAFSKDFEKEVAWLKEFGFLPTQTSLDRIKQALLPQPPLAFYDADLHTIFVLDKAEEWPLHSAFAAAYADAIADHFLHPPQCNEADCRLAVAAAEAGYSSFLFAQWFSKFSLASPQPTAKESFTPQPQPVKPPFAAYQDWYFPQDYGLEFMLSLSRRGDKALVAALAAPPLSTEQIMHPRRYPSDKPQNVPLPSKEALISALGPEWDEVDRGVFGEWHTYLLLTASQPAGAQLLPSSAWVAVEGWGGDGYAVFSRGREHAWLVDWRWDSKADTNEFVRTFVRFARERYGPLQARECCALFWAGNGVHGVLRYSGQEHRAVWAEAPTQQQAEALLNAVNAPRP